MDRQTAIFSYRIYVLCNGSTGFLTIHFIFYGAVQENLLIASSSAETTDNKVTPTESNPPMFGRASIVQSGMNLSSL